MTNSKKLAKLQTRRTQINQRLKELGAGTDMEIWNEDEIGALEMELGDLEEEASDLVYDLEHGHERD